ncbi:hypothetical protein KA107_03360 [Candidatus Pacearchaeota archaeon]|nr:hypothetical protein [Candidatus Pacearchaeota archaeon]
MGVVRKYISAGYVLSSRDSSRLITLDYAECRHGEEKSLSVNQQVPQTEMVYRIFKREELPVGKQRFLEKFDLKSLELVIANKANLPPEIVSALGELE